MRNPHGTVGLMMDYMSLPQKPFRSPEERVRFKIGRINEWYDPIANRIREGRGWCFELRMSSLQKLSFLVVVEDRELRHV